MAVSQLPLKNIQIITVKEKLCLPQKGLRFLLILEGALKLYPQSYSPSSVPDACNPQSKVSDTVRHNDVLSDSGKSGEIFCLLPGSNSHILPYPEHSCARIICAAFDMEFIRKYLPGWDAIPFNLTKSLGSKLPQASSLLTRMAAAWYSSDTNKELNLMAYCCQFTAILSNYFKQLVISSREKKRSKQITFYLEANYERSVTLGELASYLHISSAYLSRYIKAHFHIGFQDYLTKIRLTHALLDLTSTGESVTAIALNNGFPNVAAFNKAVKTTFNMTPNQYRQTHLKSVDTDLGSHPDAAPTLFPVTPLLSQDLSSPQAAVTVLVKPTTQVRLKNGWRDMINLGFGIHCGQIKFQRQLTELMEKIPFKYGRIQGIFKDYNDIFEQSPTTYPFSEMDSIFDFFTSIHLLPHIDFAFITHKQEYADRMPNLELIQKFIKYYSKRYGSETLSSWRFEYSMPVQDEKKPLQTPSVYANNCKKVEQLIHTLLPRASFGGIGASPFFPWQFIDEILDALAENEITFNYISLHLFPYEPSPKIWQEIPILSTDESFFKNYIHKFKKLCTHHGFDKLPLFITHLQNELGCGTWTNDSAFMAPFLFKAYTDIYSETENIAYGAFSDMIYENSGNNPYFFGGSGIITQQNIKKPSYFALFMLSKTPPLIFHHSKHCFITSMDQQSCQILMYNYVHYTPQHCLSCQENYLMIHTRSCFLSGNTLTITLDFSHWPPGSYRLQKFRLGPEHGSALDEYIRLGIQDDLLPIELDYLRRKSGLSLSIEYIDINEQTTLSEQLEPLEICVYVLYR